MPLPPTTAADAPPAPPPFSPPPAARPLQFSVKSLLLTMTGAAIALAVLSWVGGALVAIVLANTFFFAVPVSLGTLAVYCRGYRQTFFAGMFAGAAASLIFGDVDWYVNELGELLASVAAQGFSAVACGAAALATRRFLERRGWHRSPTGREKIPRE